MKAFIFFILTFLISSVGLCCRMGEGSPWELSKDKYYQTSSNIHLVRVTHVQDEGTRSNKISFQVIKTLKGRDTKDPFSRVYVKDKYKSGKAGFDKGCATVLTIEVGKEYIFSPDTDGYYMVGPYSEKLEKIFWG